MKTFKMWVMTQTAGEPPVDVLFEFPLAGQQWARDRGAGNEMHDYQTVSYTIEGPDTASLVPGPNERHYLTLDGFNSTLNAGEVFDFARNNLHGFHILTGPSVDA
jgi:hypothetical protein